MVGPVAQTKINELLDRIRGLTPADRSNIFVLNSLQRDAEKLKNSDRYIAYIALGAVSALKSDIAKMREYHKAAINLAPVGDMNAAYNFAASLLYTDFPSEAVEWADTAFRGDPTSENLELLINTLSFSGRFTAAAKLIREWVGSRSHLLDGFEDETIIQISDYLAEHKISDEIIESIQKIGAALIREYGLHVQSRRAGLLHDEKSDWACLVVDVKPADKARGLNSALAERIASSDVPPYVLGRFNYCIRRTPE